MNIKINKNYDTAEFEIYYSAAHLKFYAISDLLSKMVFFKRVWQPLKVMPRLQLVAWLQTVRYQSFPMRYYTTLYLMGLQNYRSSKFKARKKAVLV